ncbi:MAG: IMP dehydrogenase [Bacteroidetes bacterium]|jgi:IMP dehydrogenase|nr:IMP dehydrogenase [Bacteroidota bacterium]
MNHSHSKVVAESLTYDDVLVLPDYSEVLPREASLKTRLTKNLQINVPIVSAAMDTVTESELAIAMAREGGLGIIHKNMSIERQADMIRKVKRSESGMIQDPITLRAGATIKEALEIMKEHHIGGIPIVDEIGILVGILTNRDLRFERDVNKKVQEVMTSDGLVTATKGISLHDAQDILQANKIEKLPVVDGGKLVGLITFRDIKKVSEHPNACKDSYGRLRVGAALGITADVLDRVEALVKAGVDVVSLDSAHGHSKGVIQTLALIKKHYPELQVIGGNVATAQGALALAQAGADAVKVGVGPGSICTTRIIAGIGVPQLSAIMDAVSALHELGIPVIADGGIRYTGDIVKALVAGADTIMAGSLFAGVDEAPGETVIYEGRKFKTYRGMGSIEAMQMGSTDRYFQDPEEEIKKLVPEGIVGRVPYKGTLAEVMYQYVGGLKAGMGYCGAATVPELQAKGRFVKITSAGARESHPHDIIITKEAPNYSTR